VNSAARWLPAFSLRWVRCAVVCGLVAGVLAVVVVAEPVAVVSVAVVSVAVVSVAAASLAVGWLGERLTALRTPNATPKAAMTQTTATATLRMAVSVGGRSSIVHHPSTSLPER
jgi:hypothetical protein